MKNLFYRLILFLDTAQESDTNYKIAWFMANNFYRIADMRINELARECYVSPATISRFCRTLGYENFAHLKHECRKFHSNDRKFNNLINMPLDLMIKDPNTTTRMYVERITRSLSSLQSHLNWHVIDECLKLIYQSKQVAFFGTEFSQSAALYLQTDLLMLGKFSIVYMDASRQIECARMLDKNSVAVVISVGGNYQTTNQKVLKYLKKSQCKVIVITANEKMDLEIPITHTIYIGSQEDIKTAKHNLLATVGLMSLRYYGLFCPSLDDLKDHIL